MKLKSAASSLVECSDRYEDYSSRRRRRRVKRRGLGCGDDGEEIDDDNAVVDRLVDVLVGSVVDERSRKRDSNSGDTSIFFCGVCEGWLCEPVTLVCGHTCCRRCAAVSRCSRGNCGDDPVMRGRKDDVEGALKVNVLVSALLEKWFPARTEGVRLRAQANELWRRRRRREAERKLKQAAELVPNDYLLQSSLSLVLMQSGHLEEAYQHAKTAVQIKPNWPEGYYRLATSFHCLGQYEDAIVAYLQCLALNPNMLFLRLRLLKLLKKVVKVNTRRNSLERVFSPYPVALRAYHSSPGSSANSSDDSDRSSGDDEGPRMNQQHSSRSYVSCSTKKLTEDSSSIITFFKNPRIQKFVNHCIVETCKVKKLAEAFEPYTLNPKLVDKADFECTLCYRLFWEPVTTPCGHIFCRTCLDRCLDHNPVCPLCKTSLLDYLAERRQSITEFIESAMQQFVPDEYRERQAIHNEEMAELACAGMDAHHEVPIFVCTMAFPTVPCPLHVFEPRYRLMIRRCMESGAKKFGMCPSLDDSDNGFADYGTMVEIREVQYFPDGRAIINTVGNQRFRVIRKGMRDGYNTASVEFLADEAVQPYELNELASLHQTVHEAVVNWFDQLHNNVQQRILAHFGAMPDLEDDWLLLRNGPAWYWWAVAILPLDKRAQLSILAMSSLRRRLETLQRIMNYLHKRQSC